MQEGILNVADIDTVMSDGLGPRYAFMGPLLTAHLNAEGDIIFMTIQFSYYISQLVGMLNYCERYAETIYNVSKTLGPIKPFEGAALHNVDQQLTAQVPLENLQEKRAWRNNCLASLAKLKKEIETNKHD